jgi:DUF1680 family protein
MPALPGMVFYASENNLAVNLYVESEATVPINGAYMVKVKQTTDFPTTGKVSIELAPDEEMTFNLLLRVPGWSPSTRITVNGAPLALHPAPGQFLVLNRKWAKHSKIEIDFDMGIRLIAGVKKQSGRAAVMRGPQVYCLAPTNAEGLVELDGASLGHLTLNPESFELIKDESVRPNGTAILADIWPPGDWQTLADNKAQVKLTEFPDPKGEAIYFKLQDPDVSVSDELFDRIPVRHFSFKKD